MLIPLQCSQKALDVWHLNVRRLRLKREILLDMKNEGIEIVLAPGRAYFRFITLQNLDIFKLLQIFFKLEKNITKKEMYLCKVDIGCL